VGPEISDGVIQEKHNIASYLRTLQLFSRDARLCLISQAWLGFCHFGVYAVLLNLYLLRLGYDLKFVSLVNAVGQLSFVVSSLSSGLVGRRWGNRRMMILGAGLSLVGYGLLPLIRFNQLPLQSFWLLASYTLAWSGIAVLIVNTIPYLMDVTNLEERNYVFAMVGVLLALSGFVGNLIAGLLPILFARTLGLTLDQPAPYRFPLLLGAIAVIPCLLALSLTRDIGAERQQEAEITRGTAAPLPLELIIVMMLVILLVRTGDGAARTFFNVYLDAALHASTALIAMMSAVVQLLAVPAALLAPLLIARLGLGRAIVLGSLGIALSLLPLALVPRWEAVGLGTAGVIVLTSITVPAFTVLHQEMMPLRWRTTMSSSATLARGLGWSSIALIGGFIITNLGYRSFFLTGAGLVAAGSLLFWAYFRVPRGPSASVSDMNKVAHN